MLKTYNMLSMMRCTLRNRWRTNRLSRRIVAEHSRLYGMDATRDGYVIFASLLSAPRFFFCGSELEQQRIAGQRLLLQLVQASPELFQAPASHRAFFECSVMAASEDVEFIVLCQ